MNSPETHQSDSRESLSVTQEAAERQAEALKNKFEKTGETLDNSTEQLSSARKEAEAVFAHEAGKERHSGGEPTSPAAIVRVTKRQKKAAFEKTLARAQAEMNAPARTFSKIIHAPFVEKSSEVLGSTIARPNAVLFGSASALLILSLIYFIARTYGYRLSGFEMIGAYSLGWVVGLLIDYVKVMATGRRF